MKINFSFQKNGLSVSFRDLSTEVPEGSTYLWDFGDLTGSSTEKNPTHIYNDYGFYSVTLTITPIGVEANKLTKTLGISQYAFTTLNGSIYNLIDDLIPEVLREFFDESQKQLLIDKWQLYIRPLVNRPECKEIPLEEVNNEFYYEALENQLIMELVAYDFFVNVVVNMLAAATTYLQEDSSSTEGDDENEGEGVGRIKRIVTGPTEVQYYEGLSGESASSLAKTIVGAFNPNGLLAVLIQKLCMTAGRVRIYLPICDQPIRVTPPRVVNRRKPGKLSGPNPTYPVKGGFGNKPPSVG